MTSSGPSVDRRPHDWMRGIFLIIYAFALMGFLISAVVMAVETGYPNEDLPAPPFAGPPGFQDFQERQDEFEKRQDRRQRVYAIIFGATGVVLMTAGLFVLNSPYNAVRCGLLAAGAILALTGAVIASSGGGSWLGLVISLAGLMVLAVAVRYLEEGYFMRARLGAGEP